MEPDRKSGSKMTVTRHPRQVTPILEPPSNKATDDHKSPSPSPIPQPAPGRARPHRMGEGGSDHRNVHSAGEGAVERGEAPPGARPLTAPLGPYRVSVEKFLPPSIYRDITRNPAWAPHLATVQQFRHYLRATQDMNFRITGTSDWEGHDLTVTREIPYIHRWTPIYKSSVLARFYLLESHAREQHIGALTMLTLTTYHGYFESGNPSQNSTATIPEAFQALKAGWDKLRQSIRRRSYVWILEPHRSGYPHIHVALLEPVTEKDQARIKALWHKYGCGDQEHGAQFSTPKGGTVGSIRNYLMKYMVKAWGDSTWTTAQLVFNALAWEHSWRLWGSSADITAVMKRPPKEPENVEWQTTEIRTSRFADHQVTWRKEGTALQPEVVPEEIT